MTAPVFVDTNVLIYAHQLGEPLKQSVAAAWLDRLWDEQAGRTSMQVLNECYSALTRKTRPIEHHGGAWRYASRFIAWKPLPVDEDMALRAREIEQRYRLNWWDCLIVAAAQMQRCAVLLTEDLQDRAMYGSVRVRNPFTAGVNDPTLPGLYGVDRGFVLRHRWTGRRMLPKARATIEGHVGL